MGGTSDPELEKEIEAMQKELEDLTTEEAEMDKWIDHLHKGLQETFLNNDEQSKYTYLTYEDFQNLGKVSA